MLLVTLGDLSLDIVMSPTAPIATGSDVSGTIAFRIGGSAANVARSFAGLGGSAMFIGAVGDDALGRRLVSALQAEGVQAVVSFVDDMPTARIAVFVDREGERSFVTSRGAADYLTPEAVAGLQIESSPRAYSVGLHVPAYSLLNEPISRTAHDVADSVQSRGGLISVDLASAYPLRRVGAGSARDAIRTVHPDLLFANEEEAAAIDGRLEELAPHVVIKQGRRGCLVDGEHVPTEPIEVNDSTGAGDAFDAGFLFALLGDPPVSLVDAGRAGHAAATALLKGPRPELDLW